MTRFYLTWTTEYGATYKVNCHEYQPLGYLYNALAADQHVTEVLIDKMTVSVIRGPTVVENLRKWVR